MSEPEGRRDAVDVMTEMFDNFRRYSDKAEQTEVNSVSYRLNLLWIHATAAIMIAPLFAGIGKAGMKSPSFDVMRHIPGAPWSVGMILGVSGLILGTGCVLRHKKMEIVGLIGLTLWYLLIVCSFSASVVVWYLHGADAGRVPALYAPVLYMHFAVIMVAHMINLIRTRRVEIQFGEVE